MARQRDNTAASLDAILREVVKTVYGEPEVAATRIQALAEMLLCKPVYLRGLGLCGFPDLSLLPDGQPDWNLPAPEACTALRKVLEHLAHWKRDATRFLNSAVVSQTGVPVPVTLRMSLVNDTVDPHRHFLALQGSPKDVFLAVTLILLAHGTTARVLTCPECHRAFFRTRRQTHCGKKCYDAWYWREKYTPQQKATARRAQYDKEGWSLGAKGSPLGRIKPSTGAKSKRRSSSKRKGE